MSGVRPSAPPFPHICFPVAGGYLPSRSGTSSIGDLALKPAVVRSRVSGFEGGVWFAFFVVVVVSGGLVCGGGSGGSGGMW